MHEGFKEFMEASLGTWNSEKVAVIISRTTESELNYLKSLHEELKEPLFYYKLKWKYTTPNRKGGEQLLGVDSQLEGYVFTSGMPIPVPKKYVNYTKPLKMMYEASAEHLECKSLDRLVTELCYFTSKNERTREVFLDKGHQVFHYQRMSMIEDNSHWEKDKVA